MARPIACACGTAATIIALGLTAASATAAPSEQRIRIEGRAATLFEGPLQTDGHVIKAAGDTRARACDVASNGAGGASGPTPTAAADDAMRLTGQSFDATWGPGADYFVTRFGPDGQAPGAFAYWGIIVNGIYTTVGGCQYRLNPGDSTLWLYDAFNAKPQLRLDGPSGIGEATANVEGGPSTAPVQQQFSVGLHQPFSVRVQRSTSRGDVGVPGARGPAAGAVVAPVTTDANGWQTIVRGGEGATTTAADGSATLSWSTPGWKRIKADGEGFVRSNRLDVCVLDAAGGGCGAPPADAQLRAAPPSGLTLPKSEGEGEGSGSLVDGGKPSIPKVTLGPSTVSGLRITTDGHASGLVNVRWSVSGAPLKAWRIEARTRPVKGAKAGRWKRVASGSDAVSAMLDLPAGRTSALRIRLTAANGSSATRTLPDVVVPTDDRLRAVRFGGRWARDRDPRAWRLTTTRMRKGATLTTRIQAGRPTLVVRADRRTARIELRAASGKSQRLTIRGRKDGRTVFVSGRRAKKSGTVRVKVLSGTVHVDGVAARP
jgi:hypothetical protein